MSLLLPAVAVAAFCVWLGVRIYNRRERWAKRTGIATLCILYPLSLGPAGWLQFYGLLPDWATTVCVGFYSPLTLICTYSQTATNLYKWYIYLWIPDLSGGI